MRREYGTGGIFADRTRGDGYWILQREAGWTTSGARRKQRRRFRGTEAAACKAMRQWLNEDLTTDAAPTTVKAWADRWLDIHVEQVRPQAFATDRSAVRRWIIPTIGHRKLDSLTPAVDKPNKLADSHPPPSSAPAASW